MRYASVCSGVEAATLAWEPLGWTPVWFSEIEPFPCAVLHHRLGAGRPRAMPDPAGIADARTRREMENWIRQNNKLPEAGAIPNLGDMTQIKGEEYVGTVDVLVGGTPCQGFSVAGRRGGADDDRSGLIWSYIGLLETMRPRWFVWENVPGALSANGGRDFARFISETQRVGYSVAWRILDMQYCRVDGFPYAIPQRRRRLFVVGYLGRWEYPAQVLLERDGLLGDSPPRRQAGTGVARRVAASTGGASGKEQQLTFIGGDGKPLNAPGMIETGQGWWRESEVCGTLRSEEGGTVSNVVCMATGQGNAEIGHESAPTLSCNHEAPLAFRWNASTSQTMSIGDSSPPLKSSASSEPAAVSFYSQRNVENGGNGLGVGADLSYTLNATGVHGVMHGAVIRRLTPVECERLMGFPDGWTRIPWNGKPIESCPDAPRYKACGNSFPTNVIRWIGRRIQQIESENKGKIES